MDGPEIMRKGERQPNERNVKQHLQDGMMMIFVVTMSNNINEAFPQRAKCILGLSPLGSQLNITRFFSSPKEMVCRPPPSLVR
jgi:hypothetical protein